MNGNDKTVVEFGALFFEPLPCRLCRGSGWAEYDVTISCRRTQEVIAVQSRSEACPQCTGTLH